MSKNKEFNFTVFCSDGRNDQNWFVKANNKTKARLLVSKVSTYKVIRVDIFPKYQLEDYRIRPERHKKPYLYSFGT